MKGSSALHSKLVQDTILKHQDKDTRLWKNAVGLGYDIDSASKIIFNLGKMAGLSGTEISNIMARIRKIKFGVQGSPDIQGIRKIHITEEMIGYDLGLWVGYECKSGNAKQTPQQKSFERMISDFGGLYKLIKG